jgi:signal transduction histidine kinase
LRLLEKHSRYILLTNLLILLLGGVLFFFLFKFILDRNIHKTLRERKAFAREQLAQSDSLYAYQRFSAHVFSIQRLSRAYPGEEEVKDTTIPDPLTGQPLLFRQLAFGETLRGQPYRIVVRRPLIDRNEIIQGILALLVLLIVILVIALYFANRLVSEKLWVPFHRTLSQLQTVQIEGMTSVQFPATNVTEFNELIQALQRLMERIQNDYFTLKEYSEYTTHEIQTPLAIIRSKLELLQEKNLTIEQFQLVNAANQALGRLARLKEALLLLVRIKNQQYAQGQPFQFSELLSARLTNFEELLQMSELRLSAKVTEKVMLPIHPLLAEILTDNLLSNAIKHNTVGGMVTVELTENYLLISNTGEEPRLPTQAFFERFVKSDPRSKSLGLGLAIVKAICDSNHWRIEYHFAEGCHQIQIFFPDYRFASDSVRTRW